MEKREEAENLQLEKKMRREKYREG